MKKRMFLLLMILACLAVPATVWGAAAKEIKALLVPQVKLILEGRILDTSVDTPINYQNKTYVPLRLVSEALGYEVKWDGTNQTITFEVPEDNYPLIKNDAVEIISVNHKYDLTTSLDNTRYLGSIDIDFVYTITKDVERPPVIVMEMLNKDRTVLASETKLLQKKAGTYKDYVLGDKIRLPYSMSTEREQVTKKMSEDYYYRITVK